MKKRILLFLFFSLITSIKLNVFYSQIESKDSILIYLKKIKKPTSDLGQYTFKLAKMFYNNTNYSEALFYSKKALSEANKENEIELKAKSLELIGDIYSENNELQNAVNYYLRANKIYENFGDQISSANILLQLGTINLKIENYKKTFQYLNAAKRIYLKSPTLNKAKIIDCYFILGIAFGSSEKLDSSLYYFKKCEKYYSKDNNASQYGGLLNNIGAIYSKKNNLEEALINYNKALIVFKKINSDRGIGVTISNIAYVNQKFGKYDIAIKLFEESNKYINKTDNLHYLLTNYSNLSEIYKQKQDYKNALLFQDKYLAIKNKLSNEDILSTISEEERKYELQKKDTEFKLIEKDIELKNKTLWFSLFAAFLIIGIVLLVYRNSRISLQKTKLKEALLETEKNKLTNELNFKNKELEQFALNIIEKNDFLDQLKLDFKNLLKNPDDKEIVKSISLNINQNLNLDRDRQKFEMQLDDNLKSFFHKLELNFPDLTKSEKKLASLLVIDLSSKDIAVILNISIDGIKKSRYRLRKKLNLLSDEDLANFLKKI